MIKIATKEEVFEALKHEPVILFPYFDRGTKYFGLYQERGSWLTSELKAKGFPVTTFFLPGMHMGHFISGSVPIKAWGLLLESDGKVAWITPTDEIYKRDDDRGLTLWCVEFVVERLGLFKP